MSIALRFLVADSETGRQRSERRMRTGRSCGESYVATLRTILPGASCEIVSSVEAGASRRPAAALSDYHAVFLTGSPLHVYDDTPEVRRQIDFMRAVFDAGTPSFGSCAGLQVAVVAAGGTVRDTRQGREVGFARRIALTAAGRSHPLMAGRPDVYDACTIHADEVETLPSEGALLLAANGATTVQAAEIIWGRGVFWGVQYHPELPLAEVADAVRRQGSRMAVQAARDLETQADLIDDLGREPDRLDIARQLGVDQQIADEALRQTELRNFIRSLPRDAR